MRPRRAPPALAILAAACLAALAAACAGSSGDAPPAATPTVPPAAPTAPPSATPTPTPTPAPTPSATPTATPTPAAKRYNRLDATGEAATPGSWAILGVDGGVLTTWEGLRADAATLRLHQTDASGASQAAAYGGVESGDIIEWRKADDCWMRYRVTGAPTRPASGSSRWEFPVEWMTYAGTGTGCTGAVGAATVLRVDEEPSAVQSPGIASPVRHGPLYLLVPASWTGTLEEQTSSRGEVAGASGAQGAPTTAPTPVGTSDVAEARRLPLWRDPILPADWRFGHVQSGGESVAPLGGYHATYINERGYLGVSIYVHRPTLWPRYMRVHPDTGGSIRETRTIDGHPALVKYSPPGNDQRLATEVWIYDETTGIEYIVRGQDRNFRGSNIGPVIEIARSLYRQAAP